MARLVIAICTLLTVSAYAAPRPSTPRASNKATVSQKAKPATAKLVAPKATAKAPSNAKASTVVALKARDVATPKVAKASKASKKAAAAPVVAKKERWNRESTGHAARIVMAIVAPIVAPIVAAHIPLLGTGLAIGFGAYAATGAVEALHAGWKAAKATPRDGWWTPYDKFASFVGGFFGSREGLAKLLMGGGIAGTFAGAVYTTSSAGAVGSELVKSGMLRSVMNIFMPRAATVASIAVDPGKRPTKQQ